MPWKVEIIERKDPIVQLEASKSSIKDLFNDLLNGTEGFNNQITVKVVLKKCKHNGEIEFAPVYFNSVTKPVINHRFRLENTFQEILHMIDVWINNGSGRMLNQLSLNILTFQLIDLYQEVFTWTYLFRGGYRVRQVCQMTYFSFNRHNDIRL